MEQFILGFFCGMIILGIIFVLLESENGIRLKFKLKRLTPKKGDMYASYNSTYVEYWMTEDYTELFVVEFIGKRSVRIKSIEDKRSNPSVGKILDIDIMHLNSRYIKYVGNRNKKSVYDDILDGT